MLRAYELLLTHIGFESDLELAALLKPEWGVDLIIGGHSHTILEQPVKVNNILVAQAGTGTDQIGRYFTQNREGLRLLQGSYRNL